MPSLDEITARMRRWGIFSTPKQRLVSPLLRDALMLKELNMLRELGRIRPSTPLLEVRAAIRFGEVPGQDGWIMEWLETHRATGSAPEPEEEGIFVHVPPMFVTIEGQPSKARFLEKLWKQTLEAQYKSYVVDGAGKLRVKDKIDQRVAWLHAALTGKTPVKISIRWADPNKDNVRDKDEILDTVRRDAELVGVELPEPWRRKR